MNDISEQEKYMTRCLQLALLGEGNTYPNPMVGSVIVHDGKIIGEGYHQKAGEAHAEVNAIRAVKDKSLLGTSTLYVSLEPCAHFGKTPPCSKTIIEYGIPEVVIGCVDSYSEVAGKGIEMMKNKGIQVTTGILERESQELNRRFFTFHEKKRPYVFLKWAQTLDGFIDMDRSSNAYGEPTWITNQLARRVVHRQRSTEEAILIGSQTALKDNPSLTLRDWGGEQPKRIVIDRQLKLPSSLHIFNQEVPTVVLNELKNEHNENLQHLQLPAGKSSIASIIEALHSLDLQSVIVEGGKRILELFISSGLWDEAHVYVGNNWFYKGIKAPSLNGKPTYQKNYGNSRLFVYRNKL